MRLSRARSRTTPCTLARRPPLPRPGQGARQDGQPVLPQWWAFKSACIVLGRDILPSFARRGLPFSEEKWRSALLTLTVVAQSVCSAKLLTIERSIISWQPWTTLVKLAFRRLKRKRRLQQEGGDS